MLQQLARDIFGAPNVRCRRARRWLTGGVDILGELAVANNRLFILVLALGCVPALSAGLQAHPAGPADAGGRAEPRAGRASGISTAPIDRLTFFIGSGLAGVAGVALTLIGSIGPTLGTNYIVDAFLVVVVGGLGQLRGAVIAAFALGLLQSLVEYWTTRQLAKVIVFVAIVDLPAVSARRAWSRSGPGASHERA